MWCRFKSRVEHFTTPKGKYAAVATDDCVIDDVTEEKQQEYIDSSGEEISSI